MPMTNNVYSLLGLASRARKIVSGETLIMNIRNKNVSYVIIAEDASDNTKKKISDKCKSFDVQYSIEGSSDELSKAIGKHNRMAIGIMDVGFAKKIKEQIGG